MTRLATVLVTLVCPGLVLAQTQSAPLTAYWLSDTNPKSAPMYDPLLVVTSVPLDRFGEIAKLQNLRKHGAESPAEVTYILDVPILFLETHERDSIWNPDGRPIKPFYGRMVNDSNGGAMLAYDRQYRIDPAETAEVIRLLQKPEGTIQLHRLHAPVAGAERTIHAIVLLLKNQAEHSFDEGRTKR